MTRPAIYVDADACPVKDEVVRVAERHGLAVTFVSNGGLRPSRDPMIRNVVVSKGADAADDSIDEQLRVRLRQRQSKVGERHHRRTQQHHRPPPEPFEDHPRRYVRQHCAEGERRDGDAGFAHGRIKFERVQRHRRQHDALAEGEEERR